MRPTLHVAGRLACTLLTLIALLYSRQGHAQLTPTYSYSSGTTANSFPLNSTTNLCQWLLTPAELSPAVPTSGIMITRVYVMAGNTRSASTTFNNLTIRLHTNSTLTALVSGPWNTGLTTVYNPATTTLSGWTSGDWIPFDLPTPIFYNGTGNLLIEISQTGYTSGGGMTVRQGTGTGNARMYGTVGSTSSTAAGNNRLNFGFDAVPAACNGTPSTPGIATAAHNTATPVCIGGTKSITASNPNLGSGISLQWQSSASPTGPWGNVTGGSGATTLTYTTPALTASRYYRIVVTCNNSNRSANSPAYLVPVGAPQPGALAGATSFCPGDVLTFSVPNTAGTSYAWTLPTGWTGTSTTNSITVTPNGTAGTIGVTASSACGTSIASSRAMVRGSAPPGAASISGTQYICSNTAQVYSVAPVAGATSYTWTLPSGWSGTSATPTISVTNTLNSGTVSIRAQNGCGQSAATNLPVNVISSLAHPGPISGKDSVCSGELLTYSIAPVPGATSYAWVLPGGWSGTTSGTSIQAFAGTTTDSIRVTAQVSCATSPVSARRIRVYQTVTPTVSVTPPTGRLCSGLPMTFTANSTNGGASPQYTWRVNGAAVSVTGASFTTTAIRNGDQIRVALQTNATCATAGTVQSDVYTATVENSVTPGININTEPPTAICRGTEVRFTASGTGGGTAPEYQWYINDTAIIGATGTSFVATHLEDGDTVSISMRSDAVCATLDSVMSNKIGLHVVDSLLPEVLITVSPSDLIRPGDELRFEATETGGGATPDFQWRRNGENIPFATGPVFTTSALLPGDHIVVRMLSYLSCATRPVVFSNTIDLKGVALSVPGAAGNAFMLFPNPNNGSFSLGGPAIAAGTALRIEIFNALGQLVHSLNVKGTGAGWQQQISLPEPVAAGVYQLRAVLRTQMGTEAGAGTASFMVAK